MLNKVGHYWTKQVAEKNYLFEIDAVIIQPRNGYTGILLFRIEEPFTNNMKTSVKQML